MCTLFDYIFTSYKTAIRGWDSGPPGEGPVTGVASGELGMCSFMIWVLVTSVYFICRNSVWLQTYNSCPVCVSTYFPGLCTAESVHTEGWNWKGKYPRSQAGFPHVTGAVEGSPLELGVGEESLKARLGGRVLWLMAHLFCFYIIILMYFCRRTESLQVSPISLGW